MPKEIIILAIESSCDDTSAAVLKNGTILSNVVAGQKMHAKYGGVVPEIASRAHQQNIVPVVDAAIREAGITKEDITALAFTKGPGLLGSLIVGTAFAKSFAFALNLPLLAVNHMKGHILAHFIQDGSPCPKFPFLCFMHEDVSIETANWGKMVCEHLDDDNCGLLGVAGDQSGATVDHRV